MVWLVAFACEKAVDDAETGGPEPTTPTSGTTETGSTEVPPPCPSTDQPQLETTTGCILGGPTASGREQFLGIPYAVPPVGERRWTPTEPVAPWSEPLSADAFGEICVQFSESTFDPTHVGQGSEDCLTLNVFRPAGAHDLPLMVFVHGGGFMSGSGSAPYLTDDPAIAEDAVLVTLNYRLGALGFLAHPDLSATDPDGVSGNYGLQDVLVALTWVRDNAEALGGDPDRRILFGESAGALSTCAALASPRAGGLFDAAILESGPCASLANPLRDPPPLITGGEEQGLVYAEAVGCPGDDAADCLRAVPAATLAEVGQGQVGPGGEDPYTWQPWMDGVWQPATSIPEAFLAGDWNHVPVLTSTNRDEGTLFTIGTATTQAALDQWILGYALLFGVDQAELAALYDPALYGDSTDAAFAALFGDAAFVCPTIWQQEVLAAQVPARAGYWVYAGRDLSGLGAFHGSEVPYVMGTELTFASPEEQALSARMRAAWRTLADPTPTLDGFGPWPTVDQGWVQLDLDASTLVDPPRPEACALLEGSRANPYR